MKPFYADQMLLLATPEEINIIRVAVANYMNRSGLNEEEFVKVKTLYEDLTHIVESLPF